MRGLSPIHAVYPIPLLLVLGWEHVFGISCTTPEGDYFQAHRSVNQNSGLFLSSICSQVYVQARAARIRHRLRQEVVREVCLVIRLLPQRLAIGVGYLAALIHESGILGPNLQILHSPVILLPLVPGTEPLLTSSN